MDSRIIRLRVQCSCFANSNLVANKREQFHINTKVHKGLATDQLLVFMGSHIQKIEYYGFIFR